jgi:Protein of unknown function (DUF3828)
MTTYRAYARAAALALILAAGTAPALAQMNASEPDPAAWLRQVYDLYHRSEDNPKLQDQANYRIVVKRASKSLAALFKKNDACEKKEKGVCAIDSDFVVDGQDFKLSDIKVGDTVIAGNKATVTVSFTNLDAACVNTYDFVRESNQWKVNDIETKCGTDAPARIAKTLREYK